MIAEFNGKEEKIDFLIDHSFLNEAVKAEYKTYYKGKIKRMNMLMTANVIHPTQLTKPYRNASFQPPTKTQELFPRNNLSTS